MEDPASKLHSLFDELFGSYINIFLLLFCVFLLFKILRKSVSDSSVESTSGKTPPPPMKKTDLTLEQLRQFDGVNVGEDGVKRILVAVNHNIFDVSKGRHLYGPGNPYNVYAARDASRGLATFSVKPEVIRDEYDDLSDLSSSEMDSLREWETQLGDKYDKVGRLLAPGQSPTDYDAIGNDDDEEEEEDAQIKKDS